MSNYLKVSVKKIIDKDARPRYENVEKIKTPCLCLYKIGGELRVGTIINDSNKFEKNSRSYLLVDYNCQSNQTRGDVIFRTDNLQEMRNEFDVRITKGKVKIIDVVPKTKFDRQHTYCRCKIAPTDLSPRYKLEIKYNDGRAEYFYSDEPIKVKRSFEIFLGATMEFEHKKIASDGKLTKVKTIMPMTDLQAINTFELPRDG
jgi:hypothetical protein